MPRPEEEMLVGELLVLPGPPHHGQVFCAGLWRGVARDLGVGAFELGGWMLGVACMVERGRLCLLADAWLAIDRCERSISLNASRNRAGPQT